MAWRHCGQYSNDASSCTEFSFAKTIPFSLIFVYNTEQTSASTLPFRSGARNSGVALQRGNGYKNLSLERL